MKFYPFNAAGKILKKIFEVKTLTEAMNTAYWLGVNFVPDGKEGGTLAVLNGETIARLVLDDD